MTIKAVLRHTLVASVATAFVAASFPAVAQTRSPGARSARVGMPPAGAQRPTREVRLSIGEGELVTLPSTVADVWTSNPGVADVYVNNPRQIYLFGKEFGEATVFATNAAGQVVYSARIRVAQNLTSIDSMMRAAMPDADITVTTVGQVAVLNGTVRTPEDSAQAQQLVTAFLNPGVNVSQPDAQLKMAVINRLRTATPLQVNLQVRFAEVSRSFVKDIGVNMLSRDTSSGFQFGIGSGTRSPGTITSPDLSSLPQLDASARFGFPAGTISLPFDPARGDFVLPGTGTTFNMSTAARGAAFTSLGVAGRLLGLDLLGAIDLGERIGQVTTLATPNLTALSGETGTFLAGGEIPIPISQGLGAVSVEYKQYDVSLSFTPTVLSDGRISMRVRPEVSQLSSAGAVQINGTTIPALTTRRAESTLELGSGQSMVIAGLLSNTHDNSISGTPGLMNVPILGSLFRSNAFQRNETELVIVITPYLVQPVNANEIRLPTDGYDAPTDLERVLLGRINGERSGSQARPTPRMAPPTGATPAIGAVTPAQVQSAPSAGAVPAQPQPSAPQPQAAQPPAPPARERRNRTNRTTGPAATPGFSLGTP